MKTLVVTERGSGNEITGKRKMRKRALIEKEVASGCSSNDSDTDVAIIFDENTSSNSVEEIKCNKAALSVDSSPENFETEISQLVLRILTPILVMIIIIYNPLMLIQRKRNNSLLQ